MSMVNPSIDKLAEMVDSKYCILYNLLGCNKFVTILK